MKAYDFLYDNALLSDMGYIICKFDGSGTDTISNGSVITLNTVSSMNGAKNELSSAVYDEPITATFQICKHPCIYDEREITSDEARELMRWLNRKEFHKFKLINDEWHNIYLEASFNVSRIEVDGLLMGFELDMVTNSPFAHMESVNILIDNKVKNGSKIIYFESDEEGFIYPEMEITVKADGDLEIGNEFEDRDMVIKNCKNGEVIKVNYPIIESSLADHKIMNDFNWKFFRLARTINKYKNIVTFSLPCVVKMSYSPIVKIGI